MTGRADLYAQWRVAADEMRKTEEEIRRHEFALLCAALVDRPARRLALLAAREQYVHARAAEREAHAALTRPTSEDAP